MLGRPPTEAGDGDDLTSGRYIESNQNDSIKILLCWVQPEKGDNFILRIRKEEEMNASI